MRDLLVIKNCKKYFNYSSTLNYLIPVPSPLTVRLPLGTTGADGKISRVIKKIILHTFPAIFSTTQLKQANFSRYTDQQ